MFIPRNITNCKRRDQYFTPYNICDRIIEILDSTLDTNEIEVDIYIDCCAGSGNIVNKLRGRGKIILAIEEDETWENQLNEYCDKVYIESLHQIKPADIQYEGYKCIITNIPFGKGPHYKRAVGFLKRASKFATIVASILPSYTDKIYTNIQDIYEILREEDLGNVKYSVGCHNSTYGINSKFVVFKVK